jgi:nucleoside-diphosphate-sugar epimerase
VGRILVTGANGTIGKVLTEKLLNCGNEVYGLIRNPKNIDNLHPHCYPVLGDVTKYNIGLKEASWKFDACYHLAGIVNLSSVDKDNVIQDTNLYGTCNVVKLCTKYQIPHLFYCSSAYAGGLRNPYERSKSAAELVVSHSDVPKITIFKPSLALGGYQHFNQFVSLLIFLHRRMEIVRRKMEGTLRLPVIEPVFRVHGNGEGRLNLITVEVVADFMANCKDEGVFWLTNPNPPSFDYLSEVIGDFILVNLQFKQQFPAMPIEIAFEKLVRPFMPYLQGDDFPSDIKNFKLSRQDIEVELRKLVH